MDNREYMLRAIELARKGAGHVNPNPLVGAVIVKDGRIIGEGYHEQYGGLHAERNALKNCTEDPKGADIYVTLEPCCHYGKQPPCTEALIAAAIRRVYVGSADPNPKVHGKGNRQLKAAGIEVIEDFMRSECDRLNPVFFHYISTNEPYVAMKYAMSADGRIACDSGLSQWITGEQARAHVHELRNYYKGIAVGIGTVLADDPMLTCRLPGGRNPVRIVFDTKLRIPEDSRLVRSADEAPLIVVCGRQDAADSAENAADASKHDSSGKRCEIDENSAQSDTAPDSTSKEEIEAGTKADDQNAESAISYNEKKACLIARGVQVLEVSLRNGRLDIAEALTQLGRLGIDGILVEGGGTLNAAFTEAGKVNCVYAYVGAKILGGENGRFTPVRGHGAASPDEALKLTNPEIMTFGDDVLIRYEAKQSAVRMRV